MTLFIDVFDYDECKSKRIKFEELEAITINDDYIDIRTKKEIRHYFKEDITFIMVINV